MRPPLVTCPMCLGTGDGRLAGPLVSADWCPTCDGAGQIPDRRRPSSMVGVAGAWLVIGAAAGLIASSLLFVLLVRRG